MTNGLCLPLIVAALAALSTARARADIVTFDLEWSGAPFGNRATATGTITIDTAAINNPNVTQQNSGFVKAFEITIKGAASGNGTFDYLDFVQSVNFGGFLIQDADTLNFNLPLVGQLTANGRWGPGGVGDFNIFSNDLQFSHAPNGVNTFVFATDAGKEDKLVLTSFNPAPVLVPEPSTVVPVGVLLLAVTFLVAFPPGATDPR
jgi:hypothetical protein